MLFYCETLLKSLQGFLQFCVALCEHKHPPLLKAQYPTQLKLKTYQTTMLLQYANLYIPALTSFLFSLRVFPPYPLPASALLRDSFMPHLLVLPHCCLPPSCSSCCSRKLLKSHSPWGMPN